MSDSVVIKLVTGDMMMATLMLETDDTVIVHDPIAVKTIQANKNGAIVERTVTAPYCGLTDEREYVFDRRNVLYVKKLNDTVDKYYTRLVKEFEETFTIDNVDSLSDEFKEDDQEEHDHEIEGFLIIPEDQKIH